MATEGTKLFKFPCEDDNKCCLCFPLKVGIQIFAVFSWIGAVMGLVSFFQFLFGLGVVPALFISPFVLLECYIAFIYYQWWKNDNSETTMRLAKVLGILILLGVVGMISLALVMLISAPFDIGLLLTIVVQVGIQMAVGYYYYNIFVRHNITAHGGSSGFAKA